MCTVCVLCRHGTDEEETDEGITLLTLARVVGLGDTAGRDRLVLGDVGDVGELDILGEAVTGLEGGHISLLVWFSLREI